MPKATDWLSKEKRELFAKAVNSMLMTNPKLEIETALKRAETIVNKAFKLYPDGYEEVEDTEYPDVKTIRED